MSSRDLSVFRSIILDLHILYNRCALQTLTLFIFVRQVMKCQHISLEEKHVPIYTFCACWWFTCVF